MFVFLSPGTCPEREQSHLSRLHGRFPEVEWAGMRKSGICNCQPGTGVGEQRGSEALVAFWHKCC